MGISSAQKQKLVDAGFAVVLHPASRKYDWLHEGNGSSATGYETRSEAWAACWAHAVAEGMRLAAEQAVESKQPDAAAGQRVIDSDIARYEAFVEHEAMRVGRSLPGRDEDQALRRKAEAENVLQALKQYRRAIDRQGN